MSRYEIPLHGFNSDEKEGVYVIIEGRKVSLVNYTGEPPHDLVPLYRHQAFRLVQVLTAWFASETTVHGLFEEQYSEYSDEHSAAADDS